MNKGQAFELAFVLKKMIAKRCKYCKSKRMFQVVSVTSDGTTKYSVKVSCDCGSAEYHKFGY